MKFRFCGDLDCPDWVLAEIATISKISSIKIKSISLMVLQELLQKKKTIEEKKLLQLATETKLEPSDIKASISLLNFVFMHSASHNVNSETLNFELQQLGLPKEHAKSICKNFEDFQQRLQDFLRTESLKLNSLIDYNWSIEYIFGSNNIIKTNEVLTNLQLKVNSSTKSHLPQIYELSLNSENLKILIQELKEARKIIANIEA